MTLLARMRARGLPRVAGDMRRLPFQDESFNWVLNFFTSFGYFEGERENFRVLEEIVRILTPGGRFLIDLMNPEPAIENLSRGTSRRSTAARPRSSAGTTPRASGSRSASRCAGQDEPPRTFLESVRLYQPEEVTIGLRWAGLEVDSLFGNFHGDPYERDSERLILIGHKPA